MAALISLPLSSSFSIVRFPETTVFSTRLLPPRNLQQRCCPDNYGWCTVKCRLLSVSVAPSSTPLTLIKEPHEYFDQAIITVRSGDGSHGVILHKEDVKRKKNSYRRDSDGSLILPVGGHGGDMVIYADEENIHYWNFTAKVAIMQNVVAMLMPWVF